MAKVIKKEESTVQPITLDEKDMAILRWLQHNARITVREISDKIHLSTTPVHERIKRMEEAGGSAQLVPATNGGGAKFELRIPLRS